MPDERNWNSSPFSPASELYHLRFARKLALGRKASDELTVPLCLLDPREFRRSRTEPLVKNAPRIVRRQLPSSGRRRGQGRFAARHRSIGPSPERFAAHPHAECWPSKESSSQPGASRSGGSTTRHDSYRMSQSRRPMSECIFGWGKQHGTMRKTKHRGIARVAADFLLNLIAYNLIRIPKLLAA